MIEIRKVDFETVKPLRSRAAQDGVSVKQSQNTHWFAVYVSGELAGCGGVFDRGGTARLKGIWLDPVYRGQGAGQALTDALFEFAIDELMASRLESFTREHGPFYEGRGFVRSGRTLPNGAKEYHKIV